MMNQTTFNGTVENSLAGRVADIHHLIPESGLFIVGEHFQRKSSITWT